nr:hypothetical protein [Tanacetum cinerariifolium]GEX49127.1 hypothetical protein [Tanacetum cinerariifolium]GEX49693.1 hypothetical protein [Tanacetum cinerariifolium]
MDDFKDDANNDDDSSEDHDDESDEEMTESDRDDIPDPDLTNVDQTEHEEEDVDEKFILLQTMNSLMMKGFTMEKIFMKKKRMKLLRSYMMIFTIPTPPPPPFFIPLSQQATPTPTPMASETTTSLLALLDFASISKFNKRVTNLEKDLLEIKQVDQYAETLSFIPAIFDRYMDNKLREPINKAVQAHNFDWREEAQAEKMEYIELVDSTSSYEVAATLFEFEHTKNLIDKMEKRKSFDVADYKIELYDALIKSYNTDKDIFESYGKVFSLKRSRDKRDKDRDPSTGSDRGTKRRKSSKDVESSRDSRSKEKKSLSTSKDASQSRHKSSRKSAHAEEPSHTIEDSGMQQDQEFATGTMMNNPLTRRLPKSTGSRNPNDLQLLIQIGARSHIVKTSNYLRILRIIRVILTEHQSDTKVFTMMMETLLEPTSNKLMVETDKVLKLKSIKKDDYSRFQHQEEYEHVVPKVTISQEGKRSHDDDKRLCLVDDLKEFKITFISSQTHNSKPKVNDHYINSQVKD